MRGRGAWSTLLWLPGTLAFYLPGIAPTDYEAGAVIPVLVNRLTSEFSQENENTIFSFDYYNPSFQFCKPDGGPQAVGGSLGSILFGDRMYTSPMQLKLLEDVECKYMCTSNYDMDLIAFMVRRISEDFYQHWTVDGLPVAGAVIEDDQEDVLDNGAPLGGFEDIIDINNDVNMAVKFRLYNHYDFVIDYHKVSDNKYRIVGAIVKPRSSNNEEPPEGDKNKFKCSWNDPVVFASNDEDDKKVSYSYSVKWQESATPWATRWDKYLHVFEPRINWLALVNSTVLVFFLTGLCSLALLRILRQDIATYNEVDMSEDLHDDVGWKLIHGDVFRPPKHVMVFSIMAGSGAQLLASFVCAVFLAMLGLLSPASRGAFSTALLLLLSLFSGLGGFVSSIFYKAWGGQSWKLNVLLTPVILPGIIFLMFMLLNFLLIFSEASGAVPIGNILAVFLLWALIALPLSLFAGFLGRRKDWFKTPVRVNQIARQIPPQKWYLRTVPLVLIAGVLPFLSILLQLYYIITAIWFQRLYYMFGFLLASMVAMLLICSTVTALSLYFTLNAENYHWQWRSFFVSGSPAIYIFLYSCFYMFRHMGLTTWSGKLLYIGYCLLGSFLCMLALGVVGIFTAHILVRKIYVSIKLD